VTPPDLQKVTIFALFQPKMVEKNWKTTGNRAFHCKKILKCRPFPGNCSLKMMKKLKKNAGKKLKMQKLQKSLKIFTFSRKLKPENDEKN